MAMSYIKTELSLMILATVQEIHPLSSAINNVGEHTAVCHSGSHNGVYGDIRGSQPGNF